jgi:hypothetical protein
MFEPSKAARLDPFINDFEFHGAWEDLERILVEPLDIHLSGNGKVYGRARIVPKNLYRNRSGDGDSTFQFIDDNNQSIGALNLSLNLSSHPIHEDKQYINELHENNNAHLEREKQLLEREKRLALAEADFERKVNEAKSIRSKTEIAFREHLRKKEETVRLVLDNQLKKNEEDQSMILGKYRDEYKKLESRLKVALTEIEAKERDMNRQLTDMKVKLSVSKEESQHAVDCEVSKTKILEQKLNDEKNRADRLEAELVDIRSTFNSSEQAKAENLVHMLQRQIQEFELKLSKSNNDLEVISSEKEHYRLTTHRLAKIVRQERIQSLHRSKYNHSSQNQVLDTEILLPQHFDVPSKNRKNSDKLINLKAELSKLSTSMEM